MINIEKAVIQPLKLDLYEKDSLYKNIDYLNKIASDILRIDRIHDVVSGNKWFKLKYHLEKIKEYKRESKYNTILTFGGAYSNHLVATAFTAKELGLRSIGVIRGEKPKNLSQTLQDCISYDMELKFITRSEFKNRDSNEFINDLKSEFGDFYLIPEGGASELGRLGAGDILKICNYKEYSHVMCAIGTGTMFFGIANSSHDNQQIIGIPVLKGMDNFLEDNKYLLKDLELYKRCIIFPDYHFGGYAKHTKELLDFMNQLYKVNNLPTDFVYTAKLLYAFYDLLNKNYFSPDSRILLIHSGGLQGNSSIKGQLLF